MTGSSATKVAGTREGYFARPLAPAPLPVLAGVVAITCALLAAAGDIHNDYLAVTGCVTVLAAGTAVLDFTGRKQAARQPHDLYVADKLPTEKTWLKPAMVISTVVVLTINAIKTAVPGEFGSPTPYFIAAGFLLLVMPQILARRVLRRYRPEKALKRKK